MVTANQQDDKLIITLSPNRSWSWRQTKWVILVVALVVMTVGVGWTLLGAWMVLPFAGLEVALLAFFLHRVSYATYRMETIELFGEQVQVQRGVRHPVRQWIFDKRSLCLQVTEPKRPHDRLEMSFETEDMSLPIGEFLNKEDCEAAREKLRRAGVRVVSNCWWKKG